MTRLGAAYLVAVAPLFAIWEIAQLPLYTIWVERGPAESLVAAMHCTLGDLVLAATAFAAGMAGAVRLAAMRSAARFTCITLAASIALTLAIEIVSTRWLDRWAYEAAMPTLFGIGLSPIAQWLVIPLLGLFKQQRRIERALRDDIFDNVPIGTRARDRKID
jgi:hypothetical protein